MIETVNVSCVHVAAFITHSASVAQIKYMFQHLLPDLRGKTVVDVGSRTGAVLYGVCLCEVQDWDCAV